LEVQHDGELPALDLLEHAVERFGLNEGARKTVEHEAAEGVGFLEPSAHALDDELVGHELAAVVVGLRLAPELGSRRDLRTDDVARVDVRDAGLRGDELGLGALAGPGWAEDHDVERHWR
jgi:hypothetical protein